MLITQREAKRLKKRVAQLERAEKDRRSAYVSEWPGGVNIASVAVGDAPAMAIRTARRLAHAVVCTVRENGEVLFYALPLPESK